MKRDGHRLVVTRRRARVAGRLRHHELGSVKLEDFKAAVAEGLSDAEVGRRFGYSDAWVYDLRRRHGIPSAFKRKGRPPPDAATVELHNRGFDVDLEPRAELPPGPLYEDVSFKVLVAELLLLRAPPVDRDALTARVFGDPAPRKRFMGHVVVMSARPKWWTPTVLEARRDPWVRPVILEARTWVKPTIRFFVLKPPRPKIYEDVSPAVLARELTMERLARGAARNVTLELIGGR